MNIRYISRDLQWTDSMQVNVESKLVKPLKRLLNSDHFEISVHFEMDRKRMQHRKPSYEMWAVLQTFNGRNNEIVRRQGDDFNTLLKEVSDSLRAQVQRARVRRRFSLNPFRLSPFERTA